MTTPFSGAGDGDTDGDTDGDDAQPAARTNIQTAARITDTTFFNPNITPFKGKAKPCNSAFGEMHSPAKITGGRAFLPFSAAVPLEKEEHERK